MDTSALASARAALFERNVDPEIDALDVCLRALLPLDAAARSRVIEYLDDRLKPRPSDEAAR